MWKRSAIGVVLFIVVTVSSSQIENRVVNGTSTNISNYPYMVSIYYSGLYYCGGTIIGPRWILTAAHCVDGYWPFLTYIKYGVTQNNASDVNIAYVKHTFVHPGFNKGKKLNDIAILELKTQLIFNYKTVAPVNLPVQNFETSQLQKGSPGVVIGWGLDMTGGKYQHTLQEVNVKIYSDSECMQRHKNGTSRDNICGGDDEGGIGQCSGDSGGPLLYIVPEGLIQVGVISWSIKPCGVKPYPGVHTKVSHFVNWIHQTMNTLCPKSNQKLKI